MDPTKIVISIIALFIFAGLFGAMCRLIFLLATRKLLDFASVEMKFYMVIFIVGASSALVVALVSGVVPARWGSFDYGSNPFWFLLAVFNIAFMLSFCVYSFVKSLRRDSWIVRIRK